MIKKIVSMAVRLNLLNMLLGFHKDLSVFFWFCKSSICQQLSSVSNALYSPQQPCNAVQYCYYYYYGEFESEIKWE